MHNIMEHDQQHGREMGWHGLTIVNPLLALIDCWMATWDYTIEALKAGDNNTPTGLSILGVTDVPALYVGDSFAPKTFKPLLNSKLIELLGKGTEGKDIVLASCGTIRNRGRQFFSFELGESYKAAGRDFRPYFNVGNGNDRSAKLWQNISSTCTVCDNTFTMNMATAGLIMEVKKTQFSELKLADFGKAMKAMLAGQTEFAAMLDTLGTVKVSKEDMRAFFAGFLGKPKQPLSTRSENDLDRLIALANDGTKGNAGQDYSDVFQAITDYYSHESSGGEDKWKQFVSSEFGSGLQQKQRAWAVLNVEAQRTGLVLLGRDILKATDKAKLEAKS